MAQCSNVILIFDWLTQVFDISYSFFFNWAHYIFYILHRECHRPIKEVHFSDNIFCRHARLQPTFKCRDKNVFLRHTLTVALYRWIWVFEAVWWWPTFQSAWVGPKRVLEDAFSWLPRVYENVFIWCGETLHKQPLVIIYCKVLTVLPKAKFWKDLPQTPQQIDWGRRRK